LGNDSRVRFGVFELDIANGELRKQGKPVRLQPQPSKVLAALAARPGELVTRQELRHEIWDGTTFVDFEQGLNFCIRQIRLVLGDDPEKPQFIETIPRRGYRFIADTTPLQGIQTATKGKKNTVVAFAGTILGFSFLALAGFFVYRRNQPLLPEPSSWERITNFTDSATSPSLSPDGRMLTFLRGPDTFAGPGQVYVKLLPDGDPLQLTHDTFLKMSPVFSPRGSSIAYTVAIRWDTWEVPVLGGEPRPMFSNASGLTWIDDGHVLFSKIQSGRHMGLVAATEGRGDERYLYMPKDEGGMVHRSSLSPDGRWLLLAEMDSLHGWLPCRLVPFDRTSSGKPIGVPSAHCTSVAWSPDGHWMYFSSDAGGSFHIWRQRFPEGNPEQVTSGPTEEEGIAMAHDGRSFITSVGTAEGTVWLHDAGGDRQISSEGYAEAPSLSPDGTRLFYLARLRGRGHFSAGLYPNDDLWMVDLHTNRAAPLLSSFPVTGYSVAPDGQRVACSALDGAGKSHLWIAWIDRREPPKQISSRLSESEDIPIFASNGDLFYRGSDGASHYLYRIRKGENAAEKVIQDAIVEPQSVSPDGRWAVTQVALPESEVSRGVVAYPAQGGAPVQICRTLCFVNWTLDGKFIYIHLLGTSPSNEVGRTFVIQTRSGNAFPQLPSSGVQSESDLVTLPGAKTMEGTIFPGPDTTLYTFTKQSVHRNLYRISSH
jgi:DNA-binding winged helix-turn-helix (wHTH) protein/Tol biopolymer transport system component